MVSPTTSNKTTKLLPNRTVRRYRINPLELVIFTLVTVGFGTSVFQLFRDTHDLQFATLEPMHTKPTRNVPAQGAARAIATLSGVSSVDGVAPVAHPINFEINCAENPGFQFGGQHCPNEVSTGRVLRDSPAYNPAKIR